MPRKYASAPLTRRPVRTRSRARDSPISAGSRYVPPAPGMMPSFVSGSATDAVDARTRRCVQRASSRPPPSAVEEMAEIVGIGSVESAVKVLRRWERKSAVLLREEGCC